MKKQLFSTIFTTRVRRYLAKKGGLETIFKRSLKFKTIVFTQVFSDQNDKNSKKLVLEFLRDKHKLHDLVILGRKTCERVEGIRMALTRKVWNKNIRLKILEQKSYDFFIELRQLQLRLQDDDLKRIIEQIQKIKPEV